MEKATSDTGYLELAECSRRKTLTYFVLVTTTWAVSVVVSVFCTVVGLKDAESITIWDQNHLHPTAFAMDGIVGTIYWINLFLGQLVCIASALVSCGPELMDAIAATGKHTITFNVLHVVFLVLFLFSQFAAAEVILVLNFANMSMLYFRHHSYPHLVHSSLISGPLSWAFFALYWNGFCIAPPSEAARLIGSVFVWGILGYGLFFAFAYKDSSMCLFLSLLATSVGVYHARTPIAEIQEYTSPFVIAVALFSAATAIIISKLANKRRCRRMTKADGGDG